MKVYQLTEKERELEKFKKSPFILDVRKTTQDQMLEILHHKFHYIVARYLS